MNPRRALLAAVVLAAAVLLVPAVARAYYLQNADVESNIAVARQVYNDTVLSYDNALQTVPTNIIAGIFNFNPREYFQTEEATRDAPRVDFGQSTPAAPAPEAPPAPPAQS